MIVAGLAADQSRVKDCMSPAGLVAESADFPQPLAAKGEFSEAVDLRAAFEEIACVFLDNFVQMLVRCRKRVQGVSRDRGVQRGFGESNDVEQDLVGHIVEARHCLRQRVQWDIMAVVSVRSIDG